MKGWKRIAAAAVSAAMLCTSFVFSGTSAATTDIASTYDWDALGIGGGGFVSGIVTGDEVMYARTDVGGAYKYNYDTMEWDQLFDFLTDAERGYLSVDAMCVDPTDDDTVYFLCGCGYFSDAGTRIYKTTDGGKTFTYSDVTDLIQVHGNGYGRQCGEAIAVDPDNPDVIYCGGDATAGTSGLIKSTDGGETWTAVEGYGELGLFTYTINWPTWTEHEVQTTADKYDNGANGVSTVMITGGKVYVGTSVTGMNNLHVADVGVDDFASLDSSLSTSEMPARINFDADGNLLITTMTGVIFDRGPGTCYKYNPTTGEMTDITPTDVSGNEVSAGYGGVFSDPNDSNKLVATTCAQWYSQSWSEDAWDREAIAWGDRFFKSEDGGATWREFTPGNKESWGGPLLGEYLQDGGRPWVRDKAIHWCGAIVIDPQNPDRILVTSGNGVFASDNVWDAIPQMYFEADGIEEVVALDMVSIPGGNPVSVIGDYDGFIHTSLTESTQLTPSMNTLTDSTASTAGVAYCPSNPDVMVRLAESFAKGFYTTDGGATWTELPCTLSGAKAAINQLEDGTYRIFLSDSGKIAYTDDFGGTWTDVTLPEQMSSDIMLCVDAENPQYVYAYGYYYNQYYFYSKPSATIDDARYVLMVSDDYGATFSQSQIICQYDECDNAARIAYLGEGEFVIAAGWYGAYHVTDYGKTVTKLDSVFYCKTMGYGAPKEEGGVNTLFMYGRPAEDDVDGIYRSTDAGASWELINSDHLYGGTGNGNFLVGDMNTFGTVYMSTVGCGIVVGTATGSDVEDPDPTDGGSDLEANYGDVDCNGTVNILDVIELCQASMGTIELTEQAAVNADVDLNDTVNGSDALHIMKFLVKLNDGLPIQ